MKSYFKFSVLTVLAALSLNVMAQSSNPNDNDPNRTPTVIPPGTPVGTAAASAFSSSLSSSNNNINVGGEEHKRPANTAYSAGLAVSSGTCLGSSSGGIQTAAFGLSFGSTKFDEFCDLRADAQALEALGQTRAAVHLLCSKPSIARALKSAGRPCPEGTEKPPEPVYYNVSPTSEVPYYQSR